VNAGSPIAIRKQKADYCSMKVKGIVKFDEPPEDGNFQPLTREAMHDANPGYPPPPLADVPETEPSGPIVIEIETLADFGAFGSFAARAGCQH